MGTQLGTLFTCDRCGHAQFITHKEFYRTHADNWMEIENKWLCPICAGLYRHHFQEFMKEEKHDVES